MVIPSPIESSRPLAGAVPVPLPAALVERLRDLAALRGVAAPALAEELLLEALTRAEILAAGRCSTRMGHHSAGPVPLPMQQP